MPYKSDFFPSVNGDRKYLAEDFTNRFGINYTNGIIPDTDYLLGEQLKVYAVDGTMKIKIGVGVANINGYYFQVYEEPVELELSAGSSNARTDRIVLELNLDEDIRAIVPKILEGESGTDPVSLIKTSTLYQISLAKIAIGASTVIITDNDITDERSDGSLCGVSNIKAIQKATENTDGLITKEDYKKIMDLYNMPNSMERNGIINGDFQVWQNGDTITPTSSNHSILYGYTADMWQVNREDGSLAVSKENYEPAVAQYCMRVKRMQGNTDLSAIKAIYIFDEEESKKYRSKKATLSFSLRKGASCAGTFSVKIYNYVSATEYEEIPLNSNDFIPMEIEQIFSFTTADVLPADTKCIKINIIYTPTNSSADVSDYFELTNVNWNATEFYAQFSPKSFIEELRDCMAYYEKSFDYGMAPADGAYTQITYVEGHEDPIITTNPQLVAQAYSEIVKKIEDIETYFTAAGIIKFEQFKAKIPIITFYNDTSSATNSAGKWSLVCGDTAEPIYGKAYFYGLQSANAAIDKMKFNIKVEQLPDIMSNATNTIMPFAFGVFGCWVADARPGRSS